MSEEVIKRKLPIERPCSACSAGDSRMEYHAHCPPFREVAAANARQVGGAHYGALESAYQHWDLVADTGMGYFEGQITKYIARWRRKNGIQDLEKAYHYAEKMAELVNAERYPLRRVPPTDAAWAKFREFVVAQQLTRQEEIILELCVSRATLSDLTRLCTAIELLLAQIEHY